VFRRTIEELVVIEFEVDDLARRPNGKSGDVVASILAVEPVSIGRGGVVVPWIGASSPVFVT
jgi:hypothetical protein